MTSDVTAPAERTVALPLPQHHHGPVPPPTEHRLAPPLPLLPRGTDPASRAQRPRGRVGFAVAGGWVGVDEVGPARLGVGEGGAA